MDPRGMGPVDVKLNRTAAELLARLCVELGTEDYAGVLSRALGLFDMAMRTKRQGGRLCYLTPQGETRDVVF
jgi:hypothetical protein